MIETVRDLNQENSSFQDDYANNLQTNHNSFMNVKFWFRLCNILKVMVKNAFPYGRIMDTISELSIWYLIYF